MEKLPDLNRFVALSSHTHWRKNEQMEKALRDCSKIIFDLFMRQTFGNSDWWIPQFIDNRRGP